MDLVDGHRETFGLSPDGGKELLLPGLSVSGMRQMYRGNNCICTGMYHVLVLETPYGMVCGALLYYVSGLADTEAWNPAVNKQASFCDRAAWRLWLYDAPALCILCVLPRGREHISDFGWIIHCYFCT